jgi:nucleoside-diphosphate-sugar epimerase
VNIAIFGGSGRVGQALIPALLERGHDIRALQHRSPVCAGTRIVEGDITDPAAVARVIDGADIVLQMTMRGDTIEQAVQTSVHGTINVLDAVRCAGSARQYILTSSDAAAGIWTHPHTEPITHRTSPASYPGYYSLGKVLEETLVTEYRRNYALPCTIARLSWVQQEDSILRNFVAGYDRNRPRKGPFSSEYTASQKQALENAQPFVVLPCGMDGQPLRRTLVQREDVIDALLRTVGEPKAIGETFHVSGPAFDYDQPCRYLAEKLHLPLEPVRLQAHSFEIDCSHTTDLLGWTARYDIVAMLDAALAWGKET